MILNNYDITNRNPCYEKGGFSNPYSHFKYGTWVNFYMGDASVPNITDKASIPNGAYPPSHFVMSFKGGSMSATTLVSSSSSFSNANLAGGLLAEANISNTSDLTSNIIGQGIIAASLAQLNTITAGIAGQLNATATLSQTSTLTADLGAIVDILATLSQSSTLAGDLVGALSASANLSQTSTLTADIIGQLNADAILAQTSTLNADIIGAWYMEATLTQTSTLVANIQAIGELVSNIIGTSTLTGSFAGTPGYMSATITNTSELSPENLAAAVWNSLAASFNTSGTMGEAMNNAGAGGNPWTVQLEGTYTAEELMRLMSAALVGKLSGGATTTNTIRDINDTVDRIVATVDEDGNRSVVIKDVS